MSTCTAQVCDVAALKPMAAPVGISNLGNTCHFASAVQCLMSVSSVAGAVAADTPAAAARARALGALVGELSRQSAPLTVVAECARAVCTGAPEDTHDTFMRLIDGNLAAEHALTHIVETHRACLACEWRGTAVRDRRTVFVLAPGERIEVAVGARASASDQVCPRCGGASEMRERTRMVPECIIVRQPATPEPIATEFALAAHHYVLVALCEHTGGHHRAQVRRGTQWWRVDDCSVTELTAPDTAPEGAHAYLAWYHHA